MTNQTPGRQPAPIHTDKARRAGGPPPKKSHPLLRRIGAVLAVLGCLGVMLGSAAGVALAAYLRFLAENDLSVLDLNALEVAENSIVYAQDPNTGAWVEYDTFTGETDRMLGFLQDWLGISTLDPESDNALAPLVLGSQTNGISPLELAAAYAVFNEGIYTPPALYTQVQDREGDLLLDRQGQRYARQAVSPQTAAIMNRLLQGVLTAPNGTARGRAPEGDMPAAKTGTTTDYRDFTFVGLTPYYVTAGWWGFDDPTDMSDLGVTSGRPLQTLWQDYMTQAQQDLPYRDFAQAEGVTARQYDPATGLLVPSGGATGYYTQDNLPQ